MKRIKQYILAALVATMTLSASAQQVTTMYFLENAPMRHLINPALQPVSKGYINFTPLGYSSFWVGNNSLTMSDLIYTYNGQTVTALHPEGGDRQKLLSQFRKLTLVNGDMTLGLLNMGFRIKDDGFLTLGLNQKIDLGVSVPKTMFDFLLGGGMTDLDGGINYFNLTRLGMYANVYTEVSGGYSHRINDHWTVGGKLKVLLGEAYAGLRTSNLGVDASTDQWWLHGAADMYVAAPLEWSFMPTTINNFDDFANSFKNFDPKKNLKYAPAGYGAAIDLGFTYKPVEQFQISAAIVDLGFIYWTNAKQMGVSIDTTYTGVGDFQYKDYVDENGTFQTNQLKDDVVNNLKDLAKAAKIKDMESKGFIRMPSAKLNVGLDGNFWDNRIGLGVLSQTRLYDNKIYEEVTIGAAFRPVNWFNLAVSYSLLENGKYSNIGAGLGFMPYDGINMTLAMDYIPTSYAGMDINGSKKYILPYKSKGVNVALGFSICWGSNRRDKDKDGVWDKLDLCPNTPRSVEVDEHGCPLDEDKDGVPDYLDRCLGTPAAAIGTVDSVGCPIDSDGDGTPNYLDRCPNTPAEAIGKTDSLGCPLDTDKDGVPDYKDECPNTPAEAIGHVDEKGCDLDSDHDGVPDWKDECPMVPGVKENKGCPEVKREIRQLLKKAMQGIEFETAKATIKPASYSLLDEIAQQFIENPSFIIEVQGHTDNTGKADKNLELSQARADAVRDYLISKGVPAERMTAHGYGQERPVADNKTKAGRAKNRRVEFDITFEEVTIETILDHADPEPEPAPEAPAESTTVEQ